MKTISETMRVKLAERKAELEQAMSDHPYADWTLEVEQYDRMTRAEQYLEERAGR